MLIYYLYCLCWLCTHVVHAQLQVSSTALLQLVICVKHPPCTARQCKENYVTAVNADIVNYIYNNLVCSLVTLIFIYYCTCVHVLNVALQLQFYTELKL
jgi:hypothetical protein